MPRSTYKVIELIGTSDKSWEDAAKVAVERAAQHLRELRIAEVVEQDMVITDGQKITLGEVTVTAYITPGHTPGTLSMIIEPVTAMP